MLRADSLPDDGCLRLEAGMCERQISGAGLHTRSVMDLGVLFIVGH